MRVPAVEDLRVDIGVDVVRYGTEKFLDQLEGKVPDVRHELRDAVLEKGAAAEVDDHAGERFVHGEVAVTVAADADLVAECLLECHSEHDPGVLDTVVRINVEVAFDLHLEVDEPVTSEKVEHVVEEADSGRPRKLAGAVEIEAQGDVGLRRLTGFGGFALLAHCF